MKPPIQPVILAFVCSSALAVTYDLKTDYSTTSNPNGPWSYLLNGSVASAGVRGADSFGPPGNPAIWGVSGSFEGWSQSNGSENVNYDLQTGDIYAHTPGVSGTVGIEWKSSINGTIDISTGAWMLRDIGREVSISLYLNGSLLTSGSIFSGDIYDRSNPLSFAFNDLAVSNGDIVAFVASSASTGDYFGANMTIDATAAAVGLPDGGSTGALLGLGIAGLAYARRKLSA